MDGSVSEGSLKDTWCHDSISVLQDANQLISHPSQFLNIGFLSSTTYTLSI